MTYKAVEINLLQILMEESDAEHPLPMRRLREGLISRGLVKRDGRPVDDRTIRTAVDTLIDAGYDISTFQENGEGYFLRERDFEPSEVHLLMDAVCSHQAIPVSYTKHLIQKLQTLMSRPQRNAYRSLTVVRQGPKTPNLDVFLNIELLDEAIQAQRKVQFEYLEFDPENKLHPRRGGERYLVSPFRLLCTNGHYYLFCRKAGKESAAFYRVDLIRDIVVANEDAGPRPTQEELEAAQNSTVYAWYGVPEDIEFRCTSACCRHVVDTFGTEVRFQREAGRDTYLVTVSAVPAGVKYWALQFLSEVEIVRPQWLRDEIIEAIRSNPYGVEAE